MGDPLRDRCSLRELAAKRQAIEISGEIGHFDRLCETVEADLAALDTDEAVVEWRGSAVVGELRFGFADGPASVATLVGHIEAQVAAVCQRCLRAFTWPLQTDLKLQLVVPGESTETLRDHELWELADTAVRPLDIVDEALIMAMPLSARHDDPADCVEIAPDTDEEKLQTPFASLKAQMNEGQKD